MRKYRADVVIIGGGISGLYAGYLANKLGYDVKKLKNQPIV